MSIVERCSARSVPGRPAGCSGKPTKASPRTPGSGAFACACDVIRPPNDRPPAKSGRPAPRRAASSTAARTARVRDGRRVGALRALLHERELEAQRRHLARRQALGEGGHRRVRHAGARAVREHVAGAGLRRPEPERGDAAGLADVERQRERLAFRHAAAPRRERGAAPPAGRQEVGVAERHQADEQARDQQVEVHHRAQADQRRDQRERRKDG